MNNTINNFYTAGDVCKKLNIRYFKLDYLIRTGQIFVPNKIGGRRLFTNEDIESIEELLETKKKTKATNYDS